MPRRPDITADINQVLEDHGTTLIGHSVRDSDTSVTNQIFLNYGAIVVAAITKAGIDPDAFDKNNDDPAPPGHLNFPPVFGMADVGRHPNTIAEMNTTFLRFGAVALGDVAVTRYDVDTDAAGQQANYTSGLAEVMAADRNRGSSEEPLFHILPSLTQAVGRDQDPRQELNISGTTRPPSLWDKAEAAKVARGLRPKKKSALKL